MVRALSNSGIKSGLFNLLEATIDGVHHALRKGSVTCRELVLAYLHRIAMYDRQGPSFHAIVTMNPDALKLADKLDEMNLHPDQWGKLHGIPVLLKDSVNTADRMPTTGGSLALMGMMAAEDAFIVKQMRKEGAIIIAKTNLDELTLGIWGASSYGGQVKNAYDLVRNPGGSSGGTAVGIAANCGIVGVGTDTCGSIRVPSSFNNLVGIRPTVGLVSRRGIMPNALLSDTAGPIARTVADAAILLDVLAGVDPGDADTLNAEGKIPQTYTQFLKYKGKGFNRARIGIVRKLFGTDEEADKVNVIVDTAIADLRALGADVIDPVDAPHAELMNLTKFPFWGRWEQKFQLEGYFAEMGDAAPVGTYRELAEIGSAVPVINEMLRQNAEVTTLGDPIYRDIITRGRRLARLGAEVAIGECRLDALLYPSLQVPPQIIGTGQAGTNSVWAALSGFPAITVPAGFTSEGWPVGMELLGRPWSESTLISLAHVYERYTAHRRPTSLAPETPQSWLCDLG